MKLVVGNSVSQVLDMTKEEHSRLREVLSYTVDAQTQHFSRTYNPKRYLIDKRGMFPTGLLKLVCKTFPNILVEDKRVQPKGRPWTFMFDPTKSGIAPYVDQIQAAHRAAQAHRGMIVMPTGSGKSIAMALLVQHLQVKTLIIVPTLALKTQLTEDFRKYFGPTPNIVIENIDSGDLPGHRKFDCLIVDECHFSAAKTYRDLNAKSWGDIYYRFYLTATPFRSREEEQILLESITGEKVFELTYKRAVEAGYVVPLQVFHKALPLTQMKGNVRSWHSVSSELIVNNIARNEAIVKIAQSLDTAGKSTLILVKEVKHAENLRKLFAAKGLEIAVASGENDNNRELLLEFNLKHRKTLIATGVLGVGVDTKPCDFVILAAGGKSRPQLMQNIGRCLRTYPGKTTGTAILILDRSHKFLVKHFNEVQKALAEEYGLKSVILPEA